MEDFKVKSVDIVDNCENARSLTFKRTPFILRSTNIGPCIEKWTLQYLCDVLGKELVKIHVSEHKSLDFLKKNFIYKTLIFEEFLQRASSSEHAEGHYFLSPTESYYLRSVGKDARKDIADLRLQFPAVSEDIFFPDFVPKEEIFSSIFRIASKDVSIWTHYDVMDNALIQVQGKKRAVLFPPTDALNLYLNGDKSEVMDIDNPDLENFPKFKNVTRFECCLLPGDILFIPGDLPAALKETFIVRQTIAASACSIEKQSPRSCRKCSFCSSGVNSLLVISSLTMWFHNMKYLDFGLSVNVFWKELDPVLYDKKDPYGNKDHLPAQQAFIHLNKALTNLSTLPPKYEEFYRLRLIAQIQKKMENNI